MFLLLFYFKFVWRAYYIDYVKEADDPNKIALLIPEMRYENSIKKHKYRLDYLIVNPFTMEKIGIEISPWSSHGKLTGKNKNLTELNEDAKINFEKEMEKVKKYFKKYKIPILHFTDKDIINIEQIFELMKQYLDPNDPPKQLQLHLYSEYFD